MISTLEKESLKELRKKYENFYAATDEKFNKEEFEKKVSKENRLITKGIEVGHIFYFGDKYSKALNASVDLPGGKKDFVKMGSYGVGVSRLVGAIIEANYDEKKEIMKWPFSIAPYEVSIIPQINKNDNTNLNRAITIYKKLSEFGIDPIIDDTEENFSSKMKKFDLIGVPFQILIGKNSDDKVFELKEVNGETKKLELNEIIKILKNKKDKN